MPIVCYGLQAKITPPPGPGRVRKSQVLIWLSAKKYNAKVTFMPARALSSGFVFNYNFSGDICTDSNYPKYEFHFG